MFLDEWNLSEIPQIWHLPREAYWHEEGSASCFWPIILLVKVILKARKTARAEHFQKPSPPCYSKQSTAARPALPITAHDGVRKHPPWKTSWKLRTAERRVARPRHGAVSASARIPGRWPEGTEFSLQQGTASADPLRMARVSHRR